MAMAHRLLIASIVFETVHAGFYVCTPEVECSNTYGAPIVGVETDLEAACDADSNCMSYQWNDGQSYGFLCSTTATDPDPDVKCCEKFADPSPPPSPPPPSPPPPVAPPTTPPPPSPPPPMPPPPSPPPASPPPPSPPPPTPPPPSPPPATPPTHPPSPPPPSPSPPNPSPPPPSPSPPPPSPPPPSPPPPPPPPPSPPPSPPPPPPPPPRRRRRRRPARRHRHRRRAHLHRRRHHRRRPHLPRHRLRLHRLPFRPSTPSSASFSSTSKRTGPRPSCIASRWAGTSPRCAMRPIRPRSSTPSTPPVRAGRRGSDSTIGPTRATTIGNWDRSTAGICRWERIRTGTRAIPNRTRRVA